MTTLAQAEAYNQGVRDTLANAAAAADAIEKLPNYREGRQGFATAALRSFVEAGAGAPHAQEAPKEAGR